MEFILINLIAQIFYTVFTTKIEKFNIFFKKKQKILLQI